MPFDFSTLAVPPWLPVAWGLLVGLVFSLVGAAGGILASFGLISVIGISDPNLVKPMAQALTLAQNPAGAGAAGHCAALLRSHLTGLSW